MAEANTEENTVKSEENEMSEIPSAVSADCTSVTPEDLPCSPAPEENREQVDINKPSTSKESSDPIAKKVEIEDIELPSSEEKQDVSKTDCNGDTKEEANPNVTVPLEPTEPESQEQNQQQNQESNFKEQQSTEPSSEEDVYTNTIQESLNEILKIVHGDLAMEILQSASTSADAKDNVGESNEKEQRTEKKKDEISEDDMPDSSMSTTSAKNKRDSVGSSVKSDENFGIVHSPTAIDELVEEQLASDSVLPADRADTHIVEWVKNTGNSSEEGNIVEESKSEEDTTQNEENATQNEEDTTQNEENTTQNEANTTQNEANMTQNEESTTQHEAEKRKRLSNTPPFVSSRKSQKIVSNIIKRSIKCLNKMHAMEGAAESRRKVNTAEDDKTSTRSSSSPKVPQSQQNGAALPEETAAAPTAAVSRARIKKKDESRCDNETPKGRQLLASTSRQSETTPSDVVQPRHVKAGSEPVEIRKRKSTNGQLASLGNPRKKFRDNYTREEYISNIVGGDNNESIEDLIAKAERLRGEILALENLAHAKEMEWNEILRKRKLKEEAFLRLERKIQTTAYMENEGQLPARSSLSTAEWENNGNTVSVSKERSFGSKEDLGERSSDSSSLKKEKTTRVSSQQRATPPKTNGESNRKRNETSSPESRQIGEGRQGTIVDVRSIIADHRLKHPETVPRRGRRMRNSNVNINLGAGGAMVETGHNADSRPSSTESCKSNPSASDSMNYKDMLVQFAKLSQQGESVKVPQNYPDVTLHPVTPTSAQNTSQPTGSLLHGILTKAQTPRSTTFSPTLARLLTAPERERSSPAAAAAAVAATSASMSQQSATTQHLLQTYQGSNMVSINDLLSSSKARTEITITPVVNTPAQSHSNDLIQVEDVEEEATIIDDRKGNSIGRDGKQAVKDNPPSPNAPPKCQGCVIRPAQFVCAGCGNQWYCSRSCQLAAWATHSDHCPPEPENSKTKSNV